MEDYFAKISEMDPDHSVRPIDIIAVENDEDKGEGGPVDYDYFRYANWDWSKFNPQESGHTVIRLGGDDNNRRHKSEHSGIYFTSIGLEHQPIVTALGRWYPVFSYTKSGEIS